MKLMEQVIVAGCICLIVGIGIGYYVAEIKYIAFYEDKVDKALAYCDECEQYQGMFCYPRPMSEYVVGSWTTRHLNQLPLEDGVIEEFCKNMFCPQSNYSYLV